MPQTLTEQIDKRAAAEALGKLKSGKRLTSTEKTALRRYEKEHEERQRWEFYKSIPRSTGGHCLVASQDH